MNCRRTRLSASLNLHEVTESADIKIMSSEFDRTIYNVRRRVFSQIAISSNGVGAIQNALIIELSQLVETAPTTSKKDKANRLLLSVLNNSILTRH